MMRYRRVSLIGGVAASIAFGGTVGMAQSAGTREIGPLGDQKTGRAACRATGEACFLGIDADIYRMPLTGQYVQSGDRLICATRNWSSFPPEAFSFDFLRQCHRTQIQHANRKVDDFLTRWVRREKHRFGE